MRTWKSRIAVFLIAIGLLLLGVSIGIYYLDETWDLVADTPLEILCKDKLPKKKPYLVYGKEAGPRRKHPRMQAAVKEGPIQHATRHTPWLNGAIKKFRNTGRALVGGSNSTYRFTRTYLFPDEQARNRRIQAQQTISNLDDGILDRERRMARMQAEIDALADRKGVVERSLNPFGFLMPRLPRISAGNNLMLVPSVGLPSVNVGGNGSGSGSGSGTGSGAIEPDDTDINTGGGSGSGNNNSGTIGIGNNNGSSTNTNSGGFGIWVNGQCQCPPVQQ